MGSIIHLMLNYYCADLGDYRPTSKDFFKNADDMDRKRLAQFCVSLFCFVL
jgi:hypothetical protein